MVGLEKVCNIGDRKNQGRGDRVFIITVRFEHQIEGKREYKTRSEIEDLSEVVFEGRAVGIKVENVYIG